MTQATMNQLDEGTEVLEARARWWLSALERQGWGERARLPRAALLAQAQEALESGQDALALGPWIAQVSSHLHPEALAWLAVAAEALSPPLAALARVGYERCAQRLVIARALTR